MMLSDYHSKHAVTKDALSTNDKSLGTDPVKMRVAMLSEQLNSFGEPYYIYFSAVASISWDE